MAIMTLEDFFTLTELKNGLTTCARIEELIGVMKQQQQQQLNAVDSARQWSAGAGALACTQNTECLDLFVRLDGLTFLNRWLLEAIRAAGNLPGGCDDSIASLLASLCKLPVNHHPERLRSSGIFGTVQKLMCHGNAGIEEAARAVLSRWGAGDTKCSPVRRSTSCSLSLGQGEFPSLFDGAREAVLRRSASAGAVFPEFLATRAKVEAMAAAESGGDDSSGKAESSSRGSFEAAGSSGSCEEGDGVFIRERLSGPRSSDSEEPESGEMDALEIARQVAIEVEREVVDYREELCSSSSSTSSEMSSNCAAVIPASGGDGGCLLGNEATASKFDFDLNMDACCAEDLDGVLESNLSGSPAPPIAVSASKGAPGFLISPPCFEGGGAGWRGSAATSAFRPASPRRGAFEGAGPKQRARLLDLDLNVTTAAASGEVYPATSLGAGRMELDLNCNGEEELAGSPQRQRAPRKSFDLNDDLFPPPKADDSPAITIMGSRMCVKPSSDCIGAGVGMTAFPFFGGITAPAPFLTSSAGNPSGSNTGPPGWDLNFGALQMDGGPAVDVAAAQNSLKRKEPESGWEPYGFGYKHVASWH